MKDLIPSHLYCLVMAGGQGTRFWPESNSRRPKQYLSLVSENSLLRETLTRFENLVGQNHRYIITVKEQERLAKESGENLISENGLIFEPSGRNTGPCILLGLQTLLAEGAAPSDVVVIVPSDHVILNRDGFQKTIHRAALLAASRKKIVTIGITPNFPHTGFGYIQRGEEVEESSFNVQQFREKPDMDTAKDYIRSGEYYWNAGMFVATIDVLLKEFEKHSPEMAKFGPLIKSSLGDFDELSNVYNDVPADSIDYAIMEKSKEVLVIPAEFDWNDLGSWDALESVIKQQDENTFASSSGHYVENAKGNIVFAPNKFVSLIGVDDLIIVSNKEALVVLPKSQSQNVKKIVQYLKDNPDYKNLL